MYDIHCHMLPNMDDGPTTAEESLQMARLAHQDGTRLVVATPHADALAERGGPSVLEERLRWLADEVGREGLDLRFVAGAEHRLLPDLPEKAARGDAMTLNGTRFILVELDFLQFPPYTNDTLFRLQVGQRVPVIAHPERQATIQRQPEMAEELVERGAILQVTAGSFLGFFGRAARECARRLLERGQVCVVSSDAHAARGARTPSLSPARAELCQRGGEDIARLLLVDNPRAIVENGNVVRPPPLSAPSLLGRLLRR